MPQSEQGKARLPALALGAVGVVFGDIGTNPLYAIRQCFNDKPDLVHDHGAVIGVVSLILWSLIIIVCVKYIGFVMRAEHEGEGGTFALLGEILDGTERKAKKQGEQDRDTHRRFLPPKAIVLLLLFGSAMLYGDGVITPAISVLSAVEGLKVASKAFDPFVVPLACVILVALFMLQSRGTERVGKLFGPVMVVWFITIGVLGAIQLAEMPGILVAFDPLLGLRFLTTHGWDGFVALGGVVLCFAGAEALYADLGHFGRKPIVLSWYGLVFPALILAYLGQGALLIGKPDALKQPLYAMVPHWGLYPMILLSTVATVIASQALISGAFSMTQQAVNMGYAPRYRVIHTSEKEQGQVYMPVVNAAVGIACVALVLGFRSSDSLGSAYGLAVIATMVVTSIAFCVLALRVWNWRPIAVLPLFGLFLVIETAFLAANLVKILEGAWVPLVIGLFVFTVSVIWTNGRARFHRALSDWGMPIDKFQPMMRDRDGAEEGVAILLANDPDQVPLVGRHDWLRQHLRQERVMLLKVEFSRRPYVPEEERLTVEEIGDGLLRATACFGTMQPADICRALEPDESLKRDELVFFLVQPMTTQHGNWLARARQRVFLFLGQTGLSPVEFFNIPIRQVVTVGVDLQF